MTCPARTVVAVATLLGLSCGQAVAAPAKHQARGRKPQGVVVDAHEPAVLQKVMAAQWRLAGTLPALPPVQLVHNEALEFQDFIQYAFDGGALRLCVSPGPHGGDIFALWVDTRAPRYESFAHLAPTEHYITYRRGPSVVVLPRRPVSQSVFDSLKAKQWTVEELRRQLGAPSFHWHVHVAGFLGLTYVPQGLSFIGDPITPVMYQVHAADIEEEWREEHLVDRRLPPVESLAELEYPKLQTDGREQFARDLLSQRERIAEALARGKRSADGRFVVGHVNLAGGMADAEEIVIGEGNKPERRYRVPHYINDKGYLWLNPRTVLFQVKDADLEFYTIDAATGTMHLVAHAPAPRLRPVADFGVSGAQRFWYKTDDGDVHRVAVESPKPQGSK